MNQHTKKPWRLGDAGYTIFGPKTENPLPTVVAKVFHKENATFIVRAVNSHEELLEAAKMAFKLLEKMPVTNTRSKENETYGYLANAIAKAEGR
jgi:CO dehydrogenase/acetyl-CoA synthase epsilon subunit